MPDASVRASQPAVVFRYRHFVVLSTDLLARYWGSPSSWSGLAPWR